MPITEVQRKRRTKCLGSSDVAAILGVDPYKNAYDVWMSKTGRMPDERASNPSMEAGTMFEDGVLKWGEKKLGKLKRNQFRSCPEFHLGANIDAIQCSTGLPVEAKTAALFGPLTEEWGEDGTDEIPQRVIVQCYVHMACTGTDACHVVSFIGGRGFSYHCVEKDPELMRMICEGARGFWTNHVVADVPPDDAPPSLKTVRKAKRTPNKTTVLDDAIVNHWLDAKAEVSMAKEARDMVEAEMLAAMGDAEAGQCSMGTVTYFSSTSRRVDTKRIKAERPDIAEQFMKVSESRTLRFKKAKKKAS